MASRVPAYDATSLDVLLASVPSLPRALLSRLTARMIDRMDELDGDPDDEPDEDRCDAGDAGDDEMTSGNAPGFRSYPRPLIGNEDDAEPQHCAVQNRDQSPRPPIRYDDPKRKRRPATAQSISRVGTLMLIGSR